jgi:hypothetical protein
MRDNAAKRIADERLISYDRDYTTRAAFDFKFEI